MDPKPHKTYEEQLALLQERGMVIEDDTAALALLERVGYYTLSGYSFPFRLKNLDGSRSSRFRPGTKLSQLQSLWEFDNRLRAATFAAIQPVETYLRALLAYELGAVNPLIHQQPDFLTIDKGVSYDRWLKKLENQIQDSREEFIVHHREARSGIIPIWVATDVLDWGGLSYLYSLSPPKIRTKIASRFDLSAPQLKSWFRALNVVRNVCAHHSRFFNRYYSLKPKLPALGQDESLDALRRLQGTTFSMLTLIQHLGSQTLGFNSRILTVTVRSFPEPSGLNIGALGAPRNWEELPLWK